MRSNARSRGRFGPTKNVPDARYVASTNSPGTAIQTASLDSSGPDTRCGHITVRPRPAASVASAGPRARANPGADQATATRYAA